jgi:hypothetical protein
MPAANKKSFKFDITPVLAFVAALGGGLLLNAPAQAQSNLPYQLGGGTGLSLGARQAIINDRLFQDRPNVLLRSPSGLLLGIRRENNQAFLVSPESGAILPGARPHSNWPVGLGGGLGWGGVASGSNFYAGVGGAHMSGSRMPEWIVLLPVGGGGLFYGTPSTPIDAWIQQLELI